MSTLEERIARYETNVLPTDYESDPSLSEEDNFLVLTLIYARLSMSKRGNMACIIVAPEDSADETASTAEAPPPTKRRRTSSPIPPPSKIVEQPSLASSYMHRILSHSNNYPQPHSVPLEIVKKQQPTLKKSKQQIATTKPGQTTFSIKSSQFPELHAEARSICLAASGTQSSTRGGGGLRGSTAYVSFPPCQNCLPLLVASGVRKLVYRQSLSTTSSIELCTREGVERVEVTEKEHDERLKEKANEWWKTRGEGREETRGRLERWWKRQEEEIMGEAYRQAAENAVGNVERGSSRASQAEGETGADAAPTLATL